jgi:murein DD-endopeptidase MepM/ murein hydrolase activator NlpD
MPGKYVNIFLCFCFIFFFLIPRYIFPWDQDKPFIYPLEGKVITAFRQDCPGPGGYIRRHTGIDIQGVPGTKVYASANGTVSYTGISPTGGLTVVIKHDQMIRTTYLNLAGIYVSRGDKLKQGDYIGFLGAYDDISSDTCHLHFAVIYKNSYLDPEQLLEIDYRSISRYIRLLYVKNKFRVY